MISDEKTRTISHRPVTGKFSHCYTAQHGIVSLSLILILILVLLPSAGAQPPNPNGTDSIPYTRFTPSMAIIISVLVAALFFMGFFSIYIRQCSENSGIGSVRQLGASMRARRAAAAAARGLDATVIESFPTFLYSAVKGLKIGKGALECAVCLNEFEDDETLRLIPKCDHVFHPECIDEWLTSHVTCPVCRSNLVPEPGETVQVPDLNAEPEHDLEPDNLENAAVSIRISDDHVVNVQEEPPKPVVDRNQSFNQPRPTRSWSVRSSFFGKFPRSHSTGHSLVQPGENTDRFTLRLPADVRKQVMNRALNRTTSCLVVLPREGSSRRMNRTGGDEGSSRGRFHRRLEKLDRGVKSDRWIFTMFTRASSSRSPKVVATDGEGTSSMSTSTTPKGLKMAVRLPSFKCLEPKGDETGLLPADSARIPV